MVKKIFIIFIGVGLLIFVVLAISVFINQTNVGSGITGNGTMVSEEKSLSRILSIDVRIPLQSSIHKSTENKYTLSIDSNLRDCVSISDTDHKLIVSTKECSSIMNPNISPSKDAKLDIYTTDVDRIVASYNASISLDLNGTSVIALLTLVNNNSSIIKGIINADRAELHSNGSGQTTLSGVSKEFSILQQGSGTIFAYDLKTIVTSITLSGSGGIQVFSEGILKVNGSGSGVVLYRGNPTTTISLSGSGKVTKAR